MMVAKGGGGVKQMLELADVICGQPLISHLVLRKLQGYHEPFGVIRQEVNWRN